MDVLNVEKAAEALAVSPRTVRRLVRSGQIAGVKVGGQVRIREEALQQFVYEGERRMADQLPIKSGVVGTNDYMQGGAQPDPDAFPGWNGQTNRVGEGGDAINASTLDSTFHVSGGIVADSSPDAYPGARPAPWTQGSISTSTPGWFVDAQSEATDYDVGPSSDLSSPSRPWSSGPRPSDVGSPLRSSTALGRFRRVCRIRLGRLGRGG